VAVVFDIRLPEAVWVGSLEAYVGSLLAWAVASEGEVVLSDDGGDGSVADLDSLPFEVGLDGFAAPSFPLPDLDDCVDGGLG